MPRREHVHASLRLPKLLYLPSLRLLLVLARRLPIHRHAQRLTDLQQRRRGRNAKLWPRRDNPAPQTRHTTNSSQRGTGSASPRTERTANTPAPYALGRHRRRRALVRTRAYTCECASTPAVTWRARARSWPASPWLASGPPSGAPLPAHRGTCLGLAAAHEPWLGATPAPSCADDTRATVECMGRCNIGHARGMVGVLVFGEAELGRVTAEGGRRHVASRSRADGCAARATLGGVRLELTARVRQNITTVQVSFRQSHPPHTLARGNRRAVGEGSQLG